MLQQNIFQNTDVSVRGKDKNCLSGMQNIFAFPDGPVVRELKRCGMYETINRDFGIQLHRDQIWIKDNDLKKIYYGLYRDCINNVRNFDDAKDIACKITSFHAVIPSGVKIELYKKAKGIADTLNKNPLIKAKLITFVKDWGKETFPKRDFLKSPMAKEVLIKRKQLLVSLQKEIFPLIREQFESKNTKMVYENAVYSASACYYPREDAIIFNNKNERILNTSGKQVLESLFHEMQHSDQYNDIGKGRRNSKIPQEKMAFDMWRKYLSERGDYVLNGFLCVASKFYPTTTEGYGAEYYNNPLEQGARFISKSVIDRLLDKKFKVVCQKINYLSSWFNTLAKERIHTHQS